MQEYHYESKVMGGDMAVSIIAADERIAQNIHEAMQESARAADQRFSRFIAESELSHLNAAKSLVVSDTFMEAFGTAKRLYEETKGAFNPLVDISRFGYDQDIETVRGTERTSATDSPYNLAFEDIRVEGNVITLAEGQRLDFGGFLKGHVAEQIVREASGISGVIVNLGGDLFTCGHDENGNPFEFTVEYPFDENRLLSFSADNRAVATSGSYKRHWLLHGASFHHVLDASGSKNPRTDVLSVTVVAPRGATADAYATAAFVLGSDAGAELLNAHDYEYCFIRTDGAVVSSPGLFLKTQDTAYAAL